MPLLQELNRATTYTQPCRLSETTRELSRRGLAGELGRRLVESPAELKNRPVDGSATEEMRYAQTVMLIAQTAPICIHEDELVVGAATYREAAGHYTPISGIPSTSHLTLAFDDVLESGYRGLRRKIRERLDEIQGEIDGRFSDGHPARRSGASGELPQPCGSSFWMVRPLQYAHQRMAGYGHSAHSAVHIMAYNKKATKEE